MYSVEVLLLLNILRNAYSLGIFGLGLGWNLALPDDLQDELWMEQPLDHFNQSDPRTFKLRYTKDLTAWKAGGPIFLYIGGEGPIQISISSKPSLKVYKDDIMSNLVQETGGAFCTVEHRYYGKSKPFAFEDLNSENMVYLSSRQALADLAHVLKTLKSSPDFANSKVVLVGGSYAGSLAAWMNVIYPNLVDATIASSAPVLAKKDFFEYLETVTDSLRTYGSEDCVKKIGAKFNRYNTLMQTSEGIETLKQEQNICADSDMTRAENIQLFFINQIETYYSQTVQYGYPNDIQSFCSNLSSGFNNMQVAFDSATFEKTKDSCQGVSFEDTVKKFRSIDSTYQWLYQSCTEFGYFLTSSSKKQVFTDNIPVRWYIKMCSQLFGPQFDEQRVDDGIANTNKMYGGRSPDVANVVFSNGDIDPWHNLGVLNNLSERAPSVYIKGSSHCSDIGVTDSEELRQARNEIKTIIKTWIGFNCE